MCWQLEEIKNNEHYITENELVAVGAAFLYPESGTDTSNLSFDTHYIEAFIYVNCHQRAANSIKYIMGSSSWDRVLSNSITEEPKIRNGFNLGANQCQHLLMNRFDLFITVNMSALLIRHLLRFKTYIRYQTKQMSDQTERQNQNRLENSNSF